MDYGQLIGWVIPVIVRGVAWFFAVKLGLESKEAEGLAGQIGSVLAAGAIAGVSVYTSLKGRKKLLAQEPPLILK
jgi:hypothetical protein